MGPDVTPPLPREWGTEQRRRYFDALLAYMASPGPATYDELMAAAPGLENDTLAFADGLATQPFGHWVSLLTEMRDALDGPVSVSADGRTHKYLGLLDRQDIFGAWWLYRFFPGHHTKQTLLDVAGADAGPWLAQFADSLRRYPNSGWSDVVRRSPAEIEDVAIAATAVFGLRDPGRRWEFRAHPGRRRLAWRAAVAAAAAAIAVGATVVLNQQSPVPSPTPRLAAWTLAGDIDQPAWRLASTGIGSVYVSCPSSMTCFANITGTGSSTVEVSTDGGTAWTPRNLPAGVELTAALACHASSTCIGTGVAPGTTGAEQAVAVATSDGGATWTEHRLPAGVARVEALSCPALSTCVGVGFSGPPAVTGGTSTERAIAVETTSAGTSWSAVNLPSSFYPFVHSLSCASSRDCALAGSVTANVAGQFRPTTAAALYTDDGGAHWHVAELPSDLGAVQALSCARDGDCLAVADRGSGSTPNHYAVLSSPTGGRTWHVTPGAGFSLVYASGISCPEPSTCIVTGRSAPTTSQSSIGAITSTHDGGASWTAATLPKSSTVSEQQHVDATALYLTTVTALSCPSATACVALASTAFTKQTAAPVVLRDNDS